MFLPSRFHSVSWCIKDHGTKRLNNCYWLSIHQALHVDYNRAVFFVGFLWSSKMSCLLIPIRYNLLVNRNQPEYGYLQLRLAICEFQRMSHCTLWGWSFVHVTKKPQHSPYFRLCISAQIFEGRKLTIFFTASTDTYDIIRTLPFVEPINVGPTLAMMNPAPTTIVLSDLVWNHAEALRVFQESNDVDRVIKQLTKAIDPKAYFQTLWTVTQDIWQCVACMSSHVYTLLMEW